MENNNKTIDIINSLYPADSNFTETAEIGMKLLIKAICKNWRILPTQILEEYQNLCELESY